MRKGFIWLIRPGNIKYCWVSGQELKYKKRQEPCRKKNLLTGYLMGFLICSASPYLPEPPSQGWLDPPPQSPSWKCLPTHLLEVFPHPSSPPPDDAGCVKLTKIQPAPRSLWIPRVYGTLCTYLLLHHT